MVHSKGKNLLSFLLTLVLTVIVVAALSMVTQAKTDTAAQQYVQEVQKEQREEVNQLSAAAPKTQETSPLVSAAGFLLILSIPVSALVVFLRFRRRGRGPAKKPVRLYGPREDMTFHGMASQKSRV